MAAMKIFGVFSTFLRTSCIRVMNFTFSSREDSANILMSAPAEKNRGIVLVTMTTRIPSSFRTASRASSSSATNWLL